MSQPPAIDPSPPAFAPRLIDDLLERAASEWGERPALVGMATPLNYHQFRDRVNQVAASLQQLGVAPGDRVAILDKNSHAYLELYFALPRIGAVAVPLNFRLAAPELVYILTDSTAKTLIYGAEYAATANELRGQVKALTNFVCVHQDGRTQGEARAPTRPDVAELDYTTWSAAGPQRPQPVERKTDDVFLQMYTSGTTGRPKGAMLTHANLIANTLTTAQERDYTNADADGYFYIVDRKKDMIVTGAENVYPREVEEVLYRHPSVLDAAVIGVPSPRWGEAVKAIVVPRAGRDISEAALVEFCRRELAGYKVPRSVDVVDELPRNPSGKVLKRVLREKYWADESRRVN